MKKEKICYLLPLFDLNTDSHYFHLYDFIDKAAKEADVFLIIEKSSSDISFFRNIKRIRIQKFRAILPRIIENLFLILIARLHGYQKFYTHYSYISAINTSIICKLTGGKSWYWNCGMIWLFKNNFLSQFFLKLSLKATDYLVTGTSRLISGYSKNYSIPEKKIKIMPNWIDMERFKKKDNSEYLLKKYDIKSGNKVVLFAHRLAERKGAHYITSISKNFDNSVIFLVAGDGPYKKSIEKEILQNNLQNIKLLGKVKNKHIPDLIRISDVFFMPSEEEGFPRVLIESLAGGLPYTAFDVGSVKDITPKILKQHVHAVGDINSMISSIKSILNKGKNHYSNNLIEEVKKYDQKRVISMFINLFLESSKMENIFKEMLFYKFKNIESYIAQIRCKDKKTLDLGCGFGNLLKHDPEKFIGIDINSSALSYCKSKNYKAIYASVESMPFENESFDVAVALQIIEHLNPDIAYKMISEVERILKSGGEFILSTETNSNLFWNTFSHIRPYPPQSILKLLKNSQDGLETYQKINKLEPIAIYYNGRYFKNIFLNFLSHLIANLLKFTAKNYTIILRKK